LAPSKSRTSFAWILSALVPGVFPAACSSDGSQTSGLTEDASLPDSSAIVADVGTPDATNGLELDAALDAGADAAPFDAASADSGTTGCDVGASGEPTELRCTGLYADWTNQTVASEVRQYDPGLHLWSDGASKKRWIYLPPKAPAGAAADASVFDDGGPRATIDTSNMNSWLFPNGTKFWKEFAFNGKRIETRLLWKQSDGTWYRTTYRWSDDQTTATELTDGEPDANGNGYEVPDQTACYTCHHANRDGRIADDVLGFEAVSLASSGATPITLKTLAAEGLITDTPDASTAIPGDANAIAALGYLHANCGTACHNSIGGKADSTGFYMKLEVGKLGSVDASDTYTTGVNKATTGGFTIPGETTTLRLAPNDAGASCVYYRMTLRNDLAQMPPIDSHKVDDAGAAAIAAWINNGCK
jgi:hypothetical protein